MHNEYSIDNLQLLSLSILNCSSDGCKMLLYLMEIVYDLSPGGLFLPVPHPSQLCPPPILNAFLFNFCKHILPFLCAQYGSYYWVTTQSTQLLL